MEFRSIDDKNNGSSESIDQSKRMSNVAPKGIGSIRFKNGKVTFVSAILEHADINGNEDDESRKVA